MKIRVLPNRSRGGRCTEILSREVGEYYTVTARRDRHAPGLTLVQKARLRRQGAKGRPLHRKETQGTPTVLERLELRWSNGICDGDGLRIVMVALG